MDDIFELGLPGLGSLVDVPPPPSPWPGAARNHNQAVNPDGQEQPPPARKQPQPRKPVPMVLKECKLCQIPSEMRKNQAYCDVQAAMKDGRNPADVLHESPP